MVWRPNGVARTRSCSPVGSGDHLGESSQPIDSCFEVSPCNSGSATPREVAVASDRVTVGGRPIHIAMVSDFFFPRLGGVETHIFQLSLCLIARGYKVIMITHQDGKRKGVRYMTCGLKVYYLPLLALVDGCSFPTFFGSFPMVRSILYREQIDVIHGHQATSALTHEALFHARTLGIPAVYTDHSLQGFGDAACIHINKLLKLILSDMQHCICVSHTNKENLVLRAALRPSNVSVIGNAVDTSRFTPDIDKRPDYRERINVVIMSRLTYRKGIDLLFDIIPTVNRQFGNVHWIIGGDGPKRIELDQMVEKHKLHDNVEFLGKVDHKNVRSVLVRGHVFLNCSLTEAFCIAIVEAAACGLAVVSTNVGGIPEVLPRSIIRLADPMADKLSEALIHALKYDVPRNNPISLHKQIREMYSWDNVARRTELVYNKVLRMPAYTIRDRLRVLMTSGPLLRIIVAVLFVLEMLVYYALEWWQPKDQIEVCRTFPYKRYSAAIQKLRSAKSRKEDPSIPHSESQPNVS